MDSLLSHFTPVEESVGQPLPLLYIILGLLCLACLAVFSYWLITNNSVQLPPGSYGWPLIGETLQLLKASDEFVVVRMAKYNKEIFKTSLLGERAAAFCGPAGNKFLFSNDGKLTVPWWPRSVQNILRNSFLTSVTHDAKSTRRLLTTFLKPEALQRYVRIMDAVAQQHIRTEWEGRTEVKAFSLVKSYTFALSCLLFANIQEPDCILKLQHQFEIMAKGLVQIPLNFPGTPYYRAIRAAEVIRKELELVIKQRRMDLLEKTVSPTQDLLSYLLVTGNENGQLLSEIEIIDNMLMLLYAGHDTSSSVITVLLKYLAEMPNVYDEVLREQRDVAMSKNDGELLGWEDMHKMKYSWSVVSEVMRLWSPISGTFKESIADFTYAGFTIPRGWKLYWSVSSTHMNPEYFPVPEKFDPSRFEGEGPAPYTYVPFGGGPRMCPGKEFARLEILVFLYNVVRKFRWEEVYPGESIKPDPLPVPMKGLPLHLRPHNSKA